ncbi:agamous-like MADS-box protein AGL61 [Vigna unguiculata]|uniref:agamous-like MADS-box protein AGL61 n=1 Tax=Vigna unguiculata TaxID=3917 RepID=UPI0010168467|nr:agamous-like MADS-box protein AGL61 [Vigna unguiculata]
MEKHLVPVSMDNPDFAVAMDRLKQPQKKKNTGRKKTVIKKIEKSSNKQVTFSKRRAGLFKKASELCILCNVNIAIIVFSPAEKLFCFGHPDVEAIVGSYLKGAKVLVASESRGSYEESNMQYEEAVKNLALEKKNLTETEKMVKGLSRRWWEDPIDEMSERELEQFMMALYELRKKLTERAAQLFMLSIQ